MNWDAYNYLSGIALGLVAGIGIGVIGWNIIENIFGGKK